MITHLIFADFRSAMKVDFIDTGMFELNVQMLKILLRSNALKSGQFSAGMATATQTYSNRRMSFMEFGKFVLVTQGEVFIGGLVPEKCWE